jgi:hypothetical protein
MKALSPVYLARLRFAHCSAPARAICECLKQGVGPRGGAAVTQLSIRSRSGDLSGIWVQMGPKSRGRVSRA